MKGDDRGLECVGGADDAARLRYLAIEPAMEQGRQQFAPGQVARSAKDNDVERIDGNEFCHEAASRAFRENGVQDEKLSDDSRAGNPVRSDYLAAEAVRPDAGGKFVRRHVEVSGKHSRPMKCGNDLQKALQQIQISHQSCKANLMI